MSYKIALLHALSGSDHFFPSSTPPTAMATFTYDHSIQSPTSTTSHIFGFSHNGTYLALGDMTTRRICLLDIDKQEMTCIPTITPPTSFAWNPVDSRKFIVGFSDGTFASHSFSDTEVSKTRFDSLKDRGAIQSLALSRNGSTLAIAISHGDVYIFYRKACAGMFFLS
jgi:WD40 repeat protein